MKKKIIAILILLLGVKAEAQSSVFSVVESLMAKGNYQEALRALDKENLKTLEAFHKMGSIYQSVGNYSKAIESYKNNSKNYKSLFELALVSDSYYKDKKIELGLFEKFIERFNKKNKEMTLIAVSRIKEIKQDLFMNGVVVD